MAFKSDVNKEFSPFLKKKGFEKVYEVEECIAYYHINKKTNTVMEVMFGSCGNEGTAVSIENIIGNGNRFTLAHQFMVKDSKQFKDFLLGFRSFVTHVVNA